MDKIDNCWERVGWLRVDISAGCTLPWGYGVSYRRWDCNKAVCYFFPINWAVWLFREMWFRLRDAPRGIEGKSYEIGWNTGYNIGVESGIRQLRQKLDWYTRNEQNKK